MAKKQTKRPPGLGVDSWGGPVIDPTHNVYALVDAETKRQDDLRAAEAKHVEEMAQLRAAHANEMRIAEAARIDAIRSVDVGAVNRAAEVSAAQALTLASQVATSAETLRTQVAAAASAQTTALAAALEPIQKDVQDLRRVQYEQQGQTAQRTEQRLGTSSIVAILGVVVFGLIGLASLAVSIVVSLK